MKWQPKDVIACIIICGAIAMLIMGINHTVAWIQIVIILAYYGMDLTPWIKLGRNQKKPKEE